MSGWHSIFFGWWEVPCLNHLVWLHSATAKTEQVRQGAGEYLAMLALMNRERSWLVVAAQVRAQTSTAARARRPHLHGNSMERVRLRQRASADHPSPMTKSRDLVAQMTRQI